MEKTIRVVLVSALVLVLSFGAGYAVGRYANNREPASHIVDTSGVDRIINLARSGLIEERNDIIRARIEFANERKRIAEERAIDQRERERIITERKGYADIEKRCRDTIRIVQERATGGRVEE